MNVYFRRAAAAMLAGMALTAAVPFSAQRADAADKKIVVLGDSISSGKTLTDPAQSYVSLVESHFDAEVTNLAKDTCTTSDLLVTLEDPAVQAQLAQADVILFTIGMQDIANPFLEEMNRFISEKDLQFSTVGEMFSLPRSEVPYSDDELITESLVLANALRSNRDACKENLLKIGEKLRAYPDAKVICANVYNPLSVIEQYDSLSLNRKTAYNSIMNPAGVVLKDHVNKTYETLEADYKFKVLDVYTEFDKKSYMYTGLNTMELEPNALGHQWYAEQIVTALTGVLPEKQSYALGDVDGNGSINANDATAVLIAASKLGTGNDSGLSAEAMAAADVNLDQAVNAKDATVILRYAAAIGVGKDVKISDFVD